MGLSFVCLIFDSSGYFCSSDLTSELLDHYIQLPARPLYLNCPAVQTPQTQYTLR